MQPRPGARDEELGSEGSVVGCLEDVDGLRVDRDRDEHCRALDDAGQEHAL